MPYARYGPRLCLCREWSNRSRQARYPSDGMLFAEPYRDHIVDSYFGKRGILNMASERGLLADGIDVADLAEVAKSGNAQAQDVFREYGASWEKCSCLIYPSSNRAA